MCYPNEKKIILIAVDICNNQNKIQEKGKNRNNCKKMSKLRQKQQLICLMNKTVKKMNINNNINS